jgi:UDPglucose 6-dehydrogenase
MVMKNSIVIGKGMVGKATMHELGITKYISKSSRNVEDEDLGKFKYYFLCLPTPTIKGEQDDSLIREWVVKIVKVNDNAVFIIRSTVLPSFCQSAEGLVKLVHVPEFLTEKTWKEDSEWPDIVVIGADDEKLRTEVAGIFKARHKGATFFLVDTVTSELIKYAINTFYALKVVFANQIYDYAQQIGANYETIKKVMYARKWIGKNHLDVFHNNKRGAGGKCLKKDLEAFAEASGLSILKVANYLNKEYLNANTKVN